MPVLDCEQLVEVGVDDVEVVEHDHGRDDAEEPDDRRDHDEQPLGAADAFFAPRHIDRLL